MKSFIEKYKPKTSEEIPQPTKLLKELIKNKRNILLYGPTGSCKSISIEIIAKELNHEVIEVNASDFRNKEQIETIIGNASKQKSLFEKEKLLLIEEADCISGVEDRGGAQAILNVIKTSSFPVVITANDSHNEKLKEIRKETNLVEFKNIDSKNIINILKDICEKENVKFSEKDLGILASNCNNDLRAALNDLQSNIINKELIINSEKRDYEVSIMQVLNKIFKTKNFDVHKILENSNLDLDEYTLWLDENIPLEYKDEKDLAGAYEVLSKADLFKGRIHRWQYWRLMYYQSLLLTSGISVIKNNINNNFITYKRSMRPLRIWQLNIKNSKKKTIVKKLALLTHTSTKEIMKKFNYYKNILKNENIIKELKLDEEEILFIKSLR